MHIDHADQFNRLGSTKPTNQPAETHMINCSQFTLTLLTICTNYLIVNQNHVDDHPVPDPNLSEPQWPVTTANDERDTTISPVLHQG